MLGIHDYGLFVVTGVVLNLTPGQDTMFILGRSLADGRRAGIAAALGIALGSIGHTLLAALGLSAVLATSTVAFSVVKFVGAAYLVYLGLQLILRPPPMPTMSPQAAKPGSSHLRSRERAAFMQGVLTNLTNPKVALFFLALMPQFIAPESTTKVTAFLALGATFIATGLAWCLMLALAAARLRTALTRHPGAAAWLHRAMGALFVGLGIRLAASRA